MEENVHLHTSTALYATCRDPWISQISLWPAGWHIPLCLSLSPSLISLPLSLQRLRITGHIRQVDQSRTATDNVPLIASETQCPANEWGCGCVLLLSAERLVWELALSCCNASIYLFASIYVYICIWAWFFFYLSSQLSLPETKERRRMMSLRKFFAAWHLERALSAEGLDY